MQKLEFIGAILAWGSIFISAAYSLLNGDNPPHSEGGDIQN